MSQRLKNALDNFYNAWLEVNQAWEDEGNIDCPDYPFNQSFDEIPVGKWVENFKERLDEIDAYKGMVFIKEQPTDYDSINNFYLRSDLEAPEETLPSRFKACGYVGKQPSECGDEEGEIDAWEIDRCDDEGENVIANYLYYSEKTYLEDCKILGLEN